MTLWYILCSFGSIFPVLVSWTKKNLATLITTRTDLYLTLEQGRVPLDDVNIVGLRDVIVGRHYSHRLCKGAFTHSVASCRERRQGPML
jgi:hypothetical protein